MNMDTGGFGGDDRQRYLIPAAIGGAALLLVLLLVGIGAFIRGRSGGSATATPTHTAATRVILGGTPSTTIGGGITGIPTRATPSSTAGSTLPGGVTGQPTASPTKPTAANNQVWVVSGTNGDGLTLRRTASTTGEALTVYPEGERLQQIGPDQQGDGVTWHNVRGPDGQEGFVSGDYTTPAQ
ncbi:MAG: hypothetical protein ACTHMA_02420 [Thermomicrobiales bacterium]